ncbi:TniQ family protein [Streptomyces sp. KN37]|uniref:TniQ family protein n=1 Tax=Streptomyces sp. KN37 TaxID=3090667 RepID=UPI002A749E74|nr:TniQ family protein [Streptomyces sp. KN37]WPO72673.1 TniQ family protein [Streptomyces sp. KN37]
MTTLRTLPIRVPPLPGEALDSWLETQAHLLHTPLRDLLRTLGLGAEQDDHSWHLRDWTIRLRPREADTVATVTGTDPGTVLAMALNHYDERAVLFDPATGRVERRRLWGRGSGSRYCPDCLTDNGFRWMLTWRLGWSYACLAHRRLLADLCPVCRGLQRRTPHPNYGIPVPGKCSVPRDDVVVGRKPRCGHDLTAARPLPLADGHPALTGQRVLLEAIENGSADFGVYGDYPQPVATVLSDVRILAHRALFQGLPAPLSTELPGDLTEAWRRAEQSESGRRGHRNTPTRPGYMAPSRAETTALAVTAALHILRQPDTQRAGAELEKMISESEVTPTSALHWGKGISPVLRAVQLKALAPRMLPVRELRYRAASDFPRDLDPTESISRRRVSSIPSTLWPSWALRLSPPHTRYPRMTWPALSCLLMIIGSRMEIGTAAGHLGSSLEEGDFIARLPTILRDEPGWPAIQKALLRLADHLDARPAPIDYDRRRALDYTELLPDAEWRRICRETHTRPGGEWRRRIVRSLLFERISSLSADHAPAVFACSDAGFRTAMADFVVRTTPHLAMALDEAAHRFLRDHGVTNEPLTWEPPLDLIDGLPLPGSDVRAVNIGRVHALVRQRDSPPVGTIAHELDTTIEVIRYILKHHPAPEREHTKHELRATGGVRYRLRQALPASELEALYDTIPLEEIARRHGVSKGVVNALREEYGIPVKSASWWRKLPNRVSREWLTEQYVDRRRTIQDIAVETGASKTTITRWARECDIPLRSRGGVSHDRALKSILDDQAIPPILRPATGTPGAGLRLARFAAATRYPSIRSAAHGVGLHSNNLVEQINRLERDLGAQLLHRAQRNHAMRLTEIGEQVLEAIQALADVLPELQTAEG